MIDIKRQEEAFSYLKLEQNLLGDIIQINSGKDYKHLKEGDIPVYGTGGLMTFVDEKLSEEKAIGIGRKGTINEPFILMPPFWTVDTLFWCTIKEDFNFNYVYHLISSINFLKYNEGSTLPSLSSSVLKNIKVETINDDTQKKVGNFLTSLDELIQKQEEYIDELNVQKNGYIQKIFSKKIKLQCKSGKKFSEIFVEVSEKTKINNEYEILSSTKDKVVKQKEYFEKQIASSNNIGYKIIRKNCLVLSPQNAWMGNINLNDKYEIGIVSPSYKTFKLKGINVNVAKNLIKTKDFINLINKHSDSGASTVRKNLDISSLMNEHIRLPSLEEQDKIGNFLSTLDDRIELQEKKLKQLKLKKKYYLNKIFS